MEEFIGGLWHRFITRAATRSYPQAAVRLESIERTAGILFRALGGDPGLRVAPAAEVEHGARRGWLARIAHVGEKAAQAARDDETLRLPAEIALFAERSLNRDLYLWLIAQGAALPAGGLAADSWISANQAASAATLAAFPGFASRYRRLVEAVVAERPDPRKLPADEAAAERAIRQALVEPGSVAALPAATVAQAVGSSPVWDEGTQKLTISGTVVPVAMIDNRPYILITELYRHFKIYAYWDQQENRIDLTYPFIPVVAAY